MENELLILTTIVELQDMIIRRLKKEGTKTSIGSLEERVRVLKFVIGFTNLRSKLKNEYKKSLNK